MRKDQQFVQNQLIPFLRGIMTDAKESGKSFYKYFGAERKNKEAFTNSKELYRYKYGANSLFESDTEAEKGFGVLIDELFAKMQREFHYGMHKMYLPDENGKFSQEQEEVLFKLSGNLIEKVNFKEKQTPQEKTEQNEKTIKETSNRLGLARVNVVEPLHLNPETGLIEGKILNVNDPAGSYLNVKIDPVDPEIIYFGDDSGRIAFALSNSDRDILLFQGMDSRGVMNIAGYTDTENGIPQKMEPRVGLPLETPKAKTPQEKLEMELSLKEEAEFGIEKRITEEGGGQPGQIEIKAGISATGKQARRPAYAEMPKKPRVTEEKFKEFERTPPDEGRAQQPGEAGTGSPEPGASRPQPEQPRPGGEPRRVGVPEPEQQQQKKEGSIGGKLAAIATGGVIGGGGILAGLISLDIV